MEREQGGGEPSGHCARACEARHARARRESMRRTERTYVAVGLVRICSRLQLPPLAHELRPLQYDAMHLHGCAAALIFAPACAFAQAQVASKSVIGCWKVEAGTFSVIGKDHVDPGQTNLPTVVRF